jgi:hypothetical protein
MFKTPNIQIDNSGIDLIKNYLVFKHIDYGEIEYIKIKKGHIIKNWFLTLCIGIIILTVSIFWCMLLIKGLDLDADTRFNRSYLVAIFSSIFLMVIGILIIIQSLKKCENLIITVKNSNYKIALDELEKDNKLNDMESYLKSRARLLK